MVIRGKVVMVNISELLNGVDFAGVRSRFLRTEGRDRGLRLFISYAPRDERLKKELEVHLKLLEQAGILSVWSDRQILPGGQCADEIDHNLAIADIILLLVSAEFIESRYCAGNEVDMAMQRHCAGEVVVIPVILRTCSWKQAPFGRLQPLPKSGKPIANWARRADAWTKVIKDIEEVMEKLHNESEW